jgi:predicted neuraminidase
MGKTWKSGKNVGYPKDALVGTILQEPGIVKLKNGDILMFMRTRSHLQFLSYSKDNGETWTDAVKSNIKSPNSPALIKRIPSTGDLIMVWNNNGKSQNRTPLSVAISSNEGKTWDKIKNIENDSAGSFSYPAIHFVNNDVLVAYCANGLSSIYITRLSLEWIYK